MACSRFQPAQEVSLAAKYQPGEWAVTHLQRTYLTLSVFSWVLSGRTVGNLAASSHYESTIDTATRTK